MSGDPLPIRLLLDEDVSPKVAERLQKDDHVDAIHVRDRARLGDSDRQVLAFAFREDRILVTANVRDFVRLARATDLHAGIVLLMDGDLLRDEQLATVRTALRLMENELRRRRDMVNRLLRISFDGKHKFETLPTSNGP